MTNDIIKIKIFDSNKAVHEISSSEKNAKKKIIDFFNEKYQ